jgi:hypothetical protein
MSTQTTKAPPVEHVAVSPGESGRRVVRAALWLPGLAVALGAAVATAHGLYEVAHAARVPVAIAWLYPLITDGLALVAYTATARLRGSAARYAWAVVVLAAGLSGLAQAAFLASGSAVEASPALRFGVGAWPAIAAAIVAHLLYLLATDADHDTRADASQRSTNPVQREVFSAATVQSVQPANGNPVTHPVVQRPTAVQPAVRPIELPAGPVEQPADRSGPTPARDRARAAATRHAHRHGALPTVTDLAGIAEVSRGTAAAALRTLRAQPTPLHLINTTEKDDPVGPETGTQP